MMFDRIKGPLAEFVRAITARIDWFALYPCRVVAQNADKTLELQPDNTRVPSVSKVPIRLGIPNATVTVTAGSRVHLGFEGGDPTKPYAALWGPSTVTELVIGSSAQDFVAHAAKVKASLDALVAAFNGHVHPGVTSGTSSTATPLTPIVGLATDPKCATLKVK